LIIENNQILICIFTQQANYLNLPAYIAKHLIKGNKKALSSFILRVSVLATTISVATMIVALSFINGFQQIIAEKIFNFWGHIRVQHFEPLKSGIAEASAIQRKTEIEDKLRNTDGIKSIAPFANKSAILKSTGSIEGVLVKGIDSTYPLNKINRFLIKGKWPVLSDSLHANEIAISSYTAKQLNIDQGSSLLIYFIQENGEMPKTRKLIVSGIYNTGIDVYDKIYAIGDLSMIQRLNEWDANTIGGYEIDVDDYNLMYITSLNIYQNLPTGWNANTLKELSPEIFDWLELQNTNKLILIIVMIIIAGINLITCLLILILERTKMIAMLKAVGAKENIIQQIFIYYGTWIALRGIVWGTVLGLGLCYFQQYTKFIKLNEEAYYIDAAPVAINYIQVVIISVSTLLLSLIILILPSLISRKINPSKALQFR
jgi:lipoprotein-releasing system permease protein